ncbi:exported hypothetical protein [Mesorhizobium sp. ORS 3359]|nr:exported hypothetical protein [Mesorhizobium sp. ORS 3359]
MPPWPLSSTSATFWKASMSSMLSLAALSLSCRPATLVSNVVVIMLGSFIVQRRVPEAQHQSGDRPDEQADRHAHGRGNAHPLRLCGNLCRSAIGRDETEKRKIAMVERAVVVGGQPLPEKELVLGKGLAGTQPHGSRLRRLAVLFEKRQLGRAAKPEPGLAGLAAEGAHRLEPRSVPDDRRWQFRHS